MSLTSLLVAYLLTFDHEQVRHVLQSLNQISNYDLKQLV